MNPLDRKLKALQIDNPQAAQYFTPMLLPYFPQIVTKAQNAKPADFDKIKLAVLDLAVAIMEGVVDQITPYNFGKVVGILFWALIEFLIITILTLLTGSATGVLAPVNVIRYLYKLKRILPEGAHGTIEGIIDVFKAVYRAKNFPEFLQELTRRTRRTTRTRLDPRTAVRMTGDLTNWEARQANIYGKIFGGGHLDAPKALQGVEGIFTATNGRRFQPSFKDWTYSTPANFVQSTRRKIRQAIKKLNKGIASGEVDTSIASHLLFSLKADHSSKILKMLRHPGGADDIATYKLLFGSKFDRVFFEASDGVFELDLVLGTIQRVAN